MNLYRNALNTCQESILLIAVDRREVASDHGALDLRFVEGHVEESLNRFLCKSFFPNARLILVLHLRDMYLA